jgi:hypothetical protein
VEKKFSASFNKKGKDLYNIVLEAILNLDLKLVSEDDKNLKIDVKTRMNWQNFGLNLNFSINGSKIKLISSSFQVTDYGESEKISKKIFNEIKKLSLSKKKTKPIKKEKIEQSIQKTKKSSQSKLVWWISGAVGFVILLMVIGSGGDNSSNLSVNDEQKIRQYIQQRAEMKRNCDGMWSLRGIGGKSSSEIIALCKPLGYDVKSKTWRYEPESVKKVLRQYGIYD